MGVVELENVWKVYSNGFEAVKGLSATVQDGEFISVLGPSGCGKTSTLRMIAGLEEISRGEIRIDGLRVNELLPGDRNVAMAFESYALYPHLTVFENIAYPLRIRHLPEAELREKVDAMCAALGIAAYRDQLPASLSGGAQQRTGLARALVRPASVFLLDEVLSHLDASERAMLRGEIRRVQKLMGLTALFVTHDQLEALAMSDRIAVMSDGVLQQLGTPEEIYDAPENLFVAGFVGEPAMNTLRAERVQEGGEELLAIEGQRVSARALGLTALPDVRELVVGVRPKNVVLGPPGQPGALSGRVHTFEMLGDFTLASIDLGGGQLAFKIGDPALQLALDEPVALSFEAQRVNFFDAGTSRRIAARGAAVRAGA